MTAESEHTIYWQTRVNQLLSGEGTVISWDAIPVSDDQRIRVAIIRSGGDRKKAVDLAILSGEGEIRCGDKTSKQVLLWAECDPSEVVCTVRADQGRLTVRHATRVPAGGGNPETITSSGPYMGMKVVEDAGRRTYYCNDGWEQDEFDKLVFSVELL